MAAWKSSSLVASEPKGFKSRKSLLSGKLSKQSVSETRMFGSKRGQHGKDFKIGKKFRKTGKGIMKGSFGGDMKSSSISPSIDEFDDMMNKVSGGFSNNPNKKKMFSRKQFG